MQMATKKSEIVPKSEDAPLASPLSVKFPKPVLSRIDLVAKSTGNSRSATIVYLVKWALDEYERQQRG